MIPSPLCMLWLSTRRCWWLIFGTLLGRKEDGSLTFFRSFNDWKFDEILCLLNTIQGKQIIESQKDLMFFKETKNGNFSVKLLFKALDQFENVVFPYKFIWNSWVPSKVGFFWLGKPLGANF